MTGIEKVRLEIGVESLAVITYDYEMLFTVGLFGVMVQLANTTALHAVIPGSKPGDSTYLIKLCPCSSTDRTCDF